jgi:hypothetical protein
VAGSAPGHHHAEIRCISTVQVNHPGSRPLNETELAMLDTFQIMREGPER